MVAIYARQSVDKKDSISIETQIELCKRQLPDGTPCAVYPDKGYSGSNLNRPEFQRLLADVKSGKIERILTYRLDRISRSVLDFANLVDLFTRYGVSFNSTQETFDTGTPIGRAMLSIVMTFAQLERETIQIRIRDNYYARGEKGMYLGGPAPFGFRKIETQTDQGTLKLLELNPDTAHTLVRIFKLYGEDMMSLCAIAKQLNSEAVRTPNGNHWDSSKISRILRNPAAAQSSAELYHYYRSRGIRFTNDIADFALGKGSYLYGKRKPKQRKFDDVSGHTLSLAPHDGVIPSELFLKCQKRLDGNRQIDNRKRSRITWLTGLIKCGKCEHAAVPKSSNHGRYRNIYCSGKVSYSCCDVEGNLGKLETVENAVRDRIFLWAGRYSALRSENVETNGREREKLLCRMEELDGSIRRLIDLAAESGEITSRYLDEKVRQMEKERRQLEESLHPLQESRPQDVAKEVQDIETTWDSLDLVGKNRIAELLISRILLFPDHMNIEWKYRFDLG